MTEEHDGQELDSVIEKWLDEATVMRANTELGARKSQMNSSQRDEIRPPGLCTVCEGHSGTMKTAAGRSRRSLSMQAGMEAHGGLIHTLPFSRAQESAKPSCCKASGSATNDA